MDRKPLTSENVKSVFLDSLALDSERGTLRVESISAEFSFNPKRLRKHEDEVRSYLSHVSTYFYADRGGGHVFTQLSFLRDDSRWGEVHDAERLLALGLGLGLVEFVAPRNYWSIFPDEVPYLRIDSDLLRLWAFFEKSSGEVVCKSFDPNRYEAPVGIAERFWFKPKKVPIANLRPDVTHVTEAIYNDMIVEGFFDDKLPSWILEPTTTIRVY